MKPEIKRQNKMNNTISLLLEILGVSFIISFLDIVINVNMQNLLSNLSYWIFRGFGIAIIVYLLRKFKDGWGIKDIGFKINQSWGKDIWIGFIGFCLLYLVQLPFVIINLPYQAQLLSKSFTMFSEMPVPIMLPVATLLALVFGFITGAWHEEILYRGYFQGVFSKKIAPAMGLFISFIPFGITHHFSHPDYNLFMIIIVLINGAFFCLVYYATGSLIVSMTTHAISNTIPIYAPLLYNREYEMTSYVVTVGIAVVLLGICFVGRNEVKELFRKTKEIFSISKPIHSVIGIILALIMVMIAWSKNIISDHFDTSTRLTVYGLLAIGFLSLSQLKRR